MKNKAIIVLVLIIVLAFLFRKSIARMINGWRNPDNTKKRVLELIEEQIEAIEGITLMDGSVYDQKFAESYSTTANIIAQAQYNNLNSNNVDETSLFSQLVNLKANELVAVYNAFGSKVWIPLNPIAPEIHANLFEWYSFQLCDNFYCDLGNPPLWNPLVIGCDSSFEVWHYCYEGTFMGAIWYKTTLPTSLFTDLPYYGIDDEQDAYWDDYVANDEGDG